MKLSDEVIGKIKAAAFTGVESPNIDKRLNAIYSDTLAYVPQSDKEPALAEIIEYEKAHFLSIIRTLNLYESPNSKTLLSDYSEIASYYAEKRFADKSRHFIIPAYMAKSFKDFLTKEGAGFESVAYRSLISDTLIDMLYASGQTDNMSIRIHRKYF